MSPRRKDVSDMSGWNGWWLAALAACAVSARAETWGDWMERRGDAPLAAEYRPGWAVEAREKKSSTRSEDFVEVNRGYDGDLVFTLAEGAEAPKGPLEICLLHSVAGPGEMNWPGEGAIPSDFEPMALPEARPGRAVAEEIRTVPAVFPLRVPVTLPAAAYSSASWRDRRPSALFPRYEVRDADGRVLCRGVLPGRGLAERSRSLVGTSEDDEAIKQVTENSATAERVGDLPEEMAAYRQVHSIWFTEGLWKKMEGREALGRRLLLSGVRLTGETDLVLRVRAALGTGKNGQAVGGAAIPSSLGSQGDFSLRTLDLAQPGCGHGKEKVEREASLFENEANLFGKDRDAYLALTLGSLLVFAGGTATIRGVVFLRRKGERRVAIWWALPAWTAACFAGTWLGGALVLDRRPRADVTEYRLALAGWPEMHCRAVASAMTFEPGRPTWRLPSGAVPHVRESGRLDGWWARWDAEIAPDGVRMRLPRKLSGTTLKLEAGWFEPTAYPIVLEDGTPDAPGRWAVATEDVDGAYALAEGHWRDLGAMKVGERVDPRAARKMEDNRLPGLPTGLRDAFSGRTWREPCRNPKHNHPPKEQETPNPDWVVVAWRRDAAPQVAPTWEESRTKGRTVWVVQWP